MPALADRVKESTTTTGNGTLTLDGAATGFQSFTTAFGNGVSVYYVIAGGSEWEVGIGTTGAGTLSRDTVLQSSNADAKVVFSAGTKDVFCSYVADRAVTTVDAVTLTNKTISGADNTLSNISNASLTNSSVTVNGTAIALGASGTVTAAAGTLTGATLASGVTASSLTSVGSLTALTVAGTTKIQQALEKATVSATAATGTIAYDVLTQAVLFYTSNASANWTLNIRGNSGTTLNSTMAVGESLTITFLVQQGTTPYYPTAHQIDGTSATVRWQGGTAPTAGNASSIDIYTYTVIKTASTPTYTLLGSQTRFA
jgi:hypothetical protein